MTYVEVLKGLGVVQSKEKLSCLEGPKMVPLKKNREMMKNNGRIGRNR